MRLNDQSNQAYLLEKLLYHNNAGVALIQLIMFLGGCANCGEPHDGLQMHV